MTEDSLSRAQAQTLDHLPDPAPLGWTPSESQGSNADACAKLWAASIRQCLTHAAGRAGFGRGTCSEERRTRAREWIFSDSGPAAEQRNLVLGALGVDLDAFREAAIRAGARPDSRSASPLEGWIEDELRRRE